MHELFNNAGSFSCVNARKLIVALKGLWYSSIKLVHGGTVALRLLWLLGSQSLFTGQCIGILDWTIGLTFDPRIQTIFNS